MLKEDCTYLTAAETVGIKYAMIVALGMGSLVGSRYMFQGRRVSSQRIAVMASLLSFVFAVNAADRPNIVWLSCEDMSPNLGCYGDPVAKTPTIDKLAARGIRFTNACSVAGVCAPSRSSIITGIYPSSLGTHLMRCQAPLPDFVKTFPTYLRQAGYFCTNNQKTDYQFKPPAGTWDESSAKAHWRHRPKKDQPFFAVFNFTGSHESAIVSAEKNNQVTKGLPKTSRDEAAKTLPPYYPDTPAVRDEWGRFYDGIAATDRWVGEHLRELEEEGLLDNTIVFFWSDHGVGLPRGKRTIYESGVNVPLVVAYPSTFKDAPKGAEDDRLVSLMDLGPTVLNLAGVPIPERIDGRPFLGPNLPPPRTELYLIRDRMDERYDIIRGVRTKQYRYIVNYQPWKPTYQHVAYGEQSTILQEIRRLKKEGTLEIKGMSDQPSKPVEELYDITKDPHEVVNLADSPEHQEILQSLRNKEIAWSDETRDLGLLPEAEIARRQTSATSRHAILRDAGGIALLTRLRQVALAAGQPEKNVDALTKSLADPDPAVRYWGIVGLGNLKEGASAFRDQVLAAIVDQPPVVHVAAGRYLARSGYLDEGLAKLRVGLEDKSPWVRLEAALFAEELGDKANPLISYLTRAAQGEEDETNGSRYPAAVARFTAKTLQSVKRD